MQHLFKVTPGFSPDYSGVCSVLYELEGLCVALDPGDCLEHSIYMDDPRWDEEPRLFFSPRMREIDAVVGNEAKLVGQLVRGIELTHPKFMALIGSPIPTVIGTDMKAVCRLVEKKTGVPCMSFPTTGLRNYTFGEEMAYQTLIKRFTMGQAYPAVCCDANIIGATPIDMWEPTSVTALTALLRQAGATSVSCWGIGGTLEEIAGAGGSRLNIVAAHSGLPAAKLLQKEFGTPYLAWWPCGGEAAERFVEESGALLAGRRPPLPLKAGQHSGGMRALILSEQLSANALRMCLEQEYGASMVAVASFFCMAPELMRPQDHVLREEAELTELLRQEAPFDLIAADPAYRPLLPYEPLQYLEIPHMAVSGVLRYKEAFDLVGVHANGYLDAVLNIGR